MSTARTLWEEGREPGPQVVVLAVACSLTVLVVDVALGGEVSLFFDLFFVALCVGLALVVRPSDFFVVGVLPPLLMVALFTLLAVVTPDAVAEAQDGVVQAVVSGLAHHAGALFVGYLLCLGVLGLRHRVVSSRNDRYSSNRSGSPAPRRTTSGAPLE